jgi:hypothetical protein
MNDQSCVQVNPIRASIRLLPEITRPDQAQPASFY